MRRKSSFFPWLACANIYRKNNRWNVITLSVSIVPPLLASRIQPASQQSVWLVGLLPTMSVRLSTCKLQRSISAAASLRCAELVNIRHVHYYYSDFDFDWNWWITNSFRIKLLILVNWNITAVIERSSHLRIFTYVQVPRSKTVCQCERQECWRCGNSLVRQWSLRTVVIPAVPGFTWSSICSVACFPFQTTWIARTEAF